MEIVFGGNIYYNEEHIAGVAGMFYLYILKSVKYNKSYVGIATNLERRLRQHNNGDHVYTKP